MYTKCTGEECPLKDTCYRYLFKSTNPHQSWFAKPPYTKNVDKHCSYYINDTYMNNFRAGKKL